MQNFIVDLLAKIQIHIPQGFWFIKFLIDPTIKKVATFEPRQIQFAFDLTPKTWHMVVSNHNVPYVLKWWPWPLYFLKYVLFYKKYVIANNFLPKIAE